MFAATEAGKMKKDELAFPMHRIGSGKWWDQSRSAPGLQPMIPFYAMAKYLTKLILPDSVAAIIFNPPFQGQW